MWASRLEGWMESTPFLRRIKENLGLQAFALARVPLIALVQPRLMDLGEDRVEVKIPLNYLTKNHWNTMYFGAMAVGADLSVGLLAFRLMKCQGVDMSLLFKDFHIDFLKRPKAAVHFVCEEGEKIRSMMELAKKTGERQTEAIRGWAVCPSLSADPVAEFRLGLSLKKKDGSS